MYGLKTSSDSPILRLKICYVSNYISRISYGLMVQSLGTLKVVVITALRCN